MAGKALKSLLSLEVALLKNVALEPLIAGPLLLALTRAPTDIQERILSPFRNNLLSKNASVRLARFIKTLKYLFALGVARRLNEALNRLALNYWSLQKPGTPWKWDGKTELIVITGGCSGFGYEMVKGFTGKAKVVVLDITDMPEELAKIPGVHYYKCDITDFSAISSVANTIREQHGNPTVLVNNAGIATGLGASLLTTKADGLERIFKVNLMSHFILIKEFLPAMLEGKKGHIVTLASMASFWGHPGLVDYCCTKAGALALHEGLRNELRDYLENGRCIQTTSVHPSWHRTGIVKPYEKIVEEAGTKIDPPSNVSNRIVDQVMNGRSGQLVIPDAEQFRVSKRVWPVWFEDVTNGSVFAAQTQFK